MNKNFHDLLARYVNGDCTPEEIEKINQWYEEIADRDLQLDEGEKKLMKTRMLANIQNAFLAHHKPLGKHRYLLSHPLFKVAAAVVVLVVFGLWMFTGKDFLPDDRLMEIPSLSGEMVFENQTEASRLYELPDGSTVQLEASSKIHFKKNFSVGDREVYLAGKAFFDIVKDPARPFYVYSGEIATRVLGTSFFVDAPANASKVEVKVITGKVSVFQITANGSSKNKKSSTIKNSTANGVVLSPNQKVEYFIEGGHWVTGLVEDPVPVKKLIEKETLSFVFDNASLKEVLADVNERYGIEVVTENEKIYACTFTGDVSRMALYDMLDVITNSIGSTYEVKGTRILVSGKGCN
jgi:transmembrane sensor